MQLVESYNRCKNVAIEINYSETDDTIKLSQEENARSKARSLSTVHPWEGQLVRKIKIASYPSCLIQHVKRNATADALVGYNTANNLLATDLFYYVDFDRLSLENKQVLFGSITNFTYTGFLMVIDKDFRKLVFDDIIAKDSMTELLPVAHRYKVIVDLVVRLQGKSGNVSNWVKYNMTQKEIDKIIAESRQ